MSPILTAIALAVLVEGLIGYLLDPLGDGVPGWVKRYGAMVLGVVLCVAFGVNVLPALLAGTPADVATAQLAGAVLTGIAVGSGSNKLHDLMDRARRVVSPVLTLGALAPGERHDG